jgi:hypothetical protein
MIILEILQTALLAMIVYLSLPTKVQDKVKKITRKKPQVYLPEPEVDIEKIIKEYEV